MNPLENIELNWLQKNYISVETNQAVRKSMLQYTLDDWKNAVTEIAFGEVKTFSKAIPVLKSLEELKRIDFHDNNSNYEISRYEMKELEESGIDVVLNHRKTYKDSLVNYTMHKAQIDLPLPDSPTKQ